MKPQRIVYRVQWSKRRLCWEIKPSDGGEIRHSLYQRHAIRKAIRLAKKDEAAGTPAQVMVRSKKPGRRRKAGRWRREYSYGCDSKAKG